MKKLNFGTIEVNDVMFAMSIIVICALAVLIIYNVTVKQNEEITEQSVDITTEVTTEVTTEASTEIVERIVTVTVEPEPEFSLTEEEMELIAGIVHAEAGNQDQIGKRLIVDVILNRMEDPGFPDTVNEVIYQGNQFASPMKYTIDDMAAVELECQQRIDTSVLWFRTGYFHSHGTALYQHGAHYFSGK